MIFTPDNVRYLPLMLSLTVSASLYGQSDTTGVVSLDSNSKSTTTIVKHSLFASAGFGSNMIFLGSTISRDDPYLATGLVYSYRNSLFLSASAAHITGIEPFFAYYSVSADYKHTFNSWLDISANISGFKANRSLEQTLFNNFIFSNFTTGFDWKILYTRISGGLLFSQSTTGFIQFSNSRYFQTPSFFKGRSFLSFYPEINLISGEIVTMKTITGTSTYGYSPPFRKFRRDIQPPLLAYSSRFGPVLLDVSLPITFTYRSLSLEADPCYILPCFKSNVMQAPKGFTFYLTASFRIL